MKNRQRILSLVTLLLLLSLFLVACERPLPEGTLETGELPAEPLPDAVDQDLPDPEAGGGAPAPAVIGEDGAEAYPAEEGDVPATDAETGDVPEAEAPAEGEAAAPAEGEGEAAPAEAPAEGVEEGAAGDAVTEEPAQAEGEAAPAEGEEAAPAAGEGEAAETAPAEGEATAEAPAEGAEQPAEEAAPAEDGGEATAEAPAETAPEGEAAPSGEVIHVVQPGENLFRIGLQYGVSWVEIARANGILNVDRVTAGQELVIPAVAAEATEEPAAEEAPAEEAAAEEPAAEEPAVEETPSGESTTYVVQPGDNLYRIGLSFGVNWTEIAAANGITNPNAQLIAGQEIIIPAAAADGEATTTEGEAAPAAEGAAAEVTHEVQEGETIFSIAFKYGIAWTDLVEPNALEAPYTVEPGQVLVIPAPAAEE